MVYNLCMECYDKACALQGLPSGGIEVYATRAYPWAKCTECGGDAYHLLPDKATDPPLQSFKSEAK